MKKTLGGDRLGSGKRMKVDLHGYNRSTHDLGYLWRSTMSAGTLVPFLCEVALPGDTFDINLDVNMNTHPTIGPLFGSHKAQLDVFIAPIRLYQGQLHNNKLGIGLKMSDVKLPFIKVKAKFPRTDLKDIDNDQVNPSCILSYLGIRGAGIGDPQNERKFNGVPLLMYWEIYKNYYSNKQEEVGAYIRSNLTYTGQITQVEITPGGPIGNYIVTTTRRLTAGSKICLDYVTGFRPKGSEVYIVVEGIGRYTVEELSLGAPADDGSWLYFDYDYVRWGEQVAMSWYYVKDGGPVTVKPVVKTFPLENIDLMRERILAATLSAGAFDIFNQSIEPYVALYTETDGIRNIQNSQEGLGLKTYQSDLFNNWLSEEWIGGPNGVAELSKVDTSSGSFSIDTLNLSTKVYEMLNRIVVSGGSYDDWIDAVYAHDRYTRVESPMYMGGLSKELIFQEVVSNTGTDGAPLGTLAGRGTLAKKHKGGYVHIKVDEPSYIMGIVSLTPRIDYSQGNKWDTNLTTMDDLHKPALDEIGFQELITDQMAWWDTKVYSGNIVEKRSAGLQPAWINYMTNVNRVYGNFAIQDNEMFMTLNRRYEPVYDSGLQDWTIKDLTSYIDPSKFNHIFAETSLDAQNFWVQIAVDITARRKMSAKLMPNL